MTACGYSERYKKAVQSEEAADAFIEFQLTEMDNATNMDW
jgi:predicted nucleic-acid-binding Zn-ribbon protein